MAIADLYEETITVPHALRFPVELCPPEGFDAEKLETWPRLVGRLEHVEGRLLYMPPCGDVQQDTVADVVITLGAWVRAHAEFVLATNEAGMRLGSAIRAADAAIWRRADLAGYPGGLRRIPPVLCVEVAGEDDPEVTLVEKATWYRAHGVPVVWVVLPATRELLIISAEATTRLGRSDTIAAHAALPELSPSVAELFTQIDAPLVTEARFMGRAFAASAARTGRQAQS